MHGRHVPNAAAATAAAILLFAGCGGDGEGLVDAGSTATEASVAGPAFPAAGAPVQAGVHRTSTFDPGFAITFPDGWLVQTAETSSSLTFGLGGGTSTKLRAIFAVVRPQRVIDPSATLVDGKLPPKAYVTVPMDLAEWFRTHSRLQVTNDTATTIGGNAGRIIDTTVRSAGPSTCSAASGARCVAVLSASGTDFGITEPTLVRNYVTTTPSGPLTIGMLVLDPGEAATLLPIADAMVASIDFS